MAPRVMIGVMGAGEGATADDIASAERLGELIAREGWIMLTGGRDAGVMAAATRGAKRIASSITVGVLPTESGDVAPGVDIPIFTGLGNARDAINVLSSRVVITCGNLSPGTTIEAAFAVKTGRPLILLNPNPEAQAFFKSALVARSPEEAIRLAQKFVKGTG
jgi:uncharacterized protein (TIGR00725 family)